MNLFKISVVVSLGMVLSCNPTSNKKGIVQDQIKDSLLESQSEKLEDFKIDSIKKVISLFKSGDVDKISDKIKFPLNREYPIPSIANKEEFKHRFSEVFDTILIAKIVHSKMEQWEQIGWRGISFDNGLVWMANSDGVITSVNYQNDFEKKLKQKLIAKGKQRLYFSLKTFERPIYKIETKNYLIRIDKLSNSKYRYAAWKKNATESSKPNIVLCNGEIDYQGSGGNHDIIFSTKTMQYKIEVTMIGMDPGVMLVIEKDGMKLLSESGKLIK